MNQLHPVQLGNAISTHQQLRLRLVREFPEADEETLADTVEGISDLPELIAALIRSSLADRDMADALKARMADMASRQARLLERERKKRALAASAMRDADIKKILKSDITASLRPVPPAVLIEDEGAIPAEYWRTQPPKLDRKELRDVLLSGQDVPGTKLTPQDDTLSVRTK